MADPVYRDPAYREPVYRERVVERRRGGSGLLIVLLVLAVLAAAAYALGLINVDQTRQARLPEVDVKGGQAPAFDVDTGKVVVGTKKETVEVPKVDVDTKKTDIDVPVVGVKKADGADK